MQSSLHGKNLKERDLSGPQTRRLLNTLCPITKNDKNAFINNTTQKEMEGCEKVYETGAVTSSLFSAARLCDEGSNRSEGPSYFR